MAPNFAISRASKNHAFFTHNTSIAWYQNGFKMKEKTSKYYVILQQLLSFQNHLNSALKNMNLEQAAKHFK